MKDTNEKEDLNTLLTYCRPILTIALLQWPGLTSAQILTGLGADWDDSLKEWTIYTEDDYEEGELQTRWMVEEDWSDWSIRMGDLDGRIKMKWRDDPSDWELRSGGAIVTARTVFKGDFSEWRISGSGHTITIRTRFRNDASQWNASSDMGSFAMETVYRGDPRDWYIDDEMEGVALEVKVMLVFVVLYSSTIPK